MKINKLILTVLLLIGGWSLFGQINPVNDLYYQQSYWYGNYNCPSFNCFVISWSAPNSSNDTLLGYKIYRNSTYWVFTSNTTVACSGEQPCEYSDFYDPLPFWITVRAVYNSDSLLSIVNDSVHVNDLMINIDEIKKNEISVLRNPVSAGENISLLIPDHEGDHCKIQVYSLNGRLVKELQIERVADCIINFSTNKMARGIYVINIQLNGEIINKKLMIK